MDFHARGKRLEKIGKQTGESAVLEDERNNSPLPFVIIDNLSDGVLTILEFDLKYGEEDSPVLLKSPLATFLQTFLQL